MRPMKHITTTLTILLLALNLGCDDAETPTDGERDGDAGLPATAGGLYEPCRFEGEPGGPELNGWGCDGGEGVLACMKPVGTETLSMCVEYTSSGCTAAEYDGDGFGTGFEDGASYCKVTCDDAGDCLAGMGCSAFGYCGWVHS